MDGGYRHNTGQISFDLKDSLGGHRPLNRKKKETSTIATRNAVTERERDEQILVPIANTDNVEQLMRTAVDIAEDRDAELLVMSAVTVPEQTPLERADRFADEERDIVNEAIALADETTVPVHGLIRVGHEPEEIIVHTVDQHDCDTVVMGWGGHGHRRQEVAIGSTVDDVVRGADCDVLVERIGPMTGTDVKSILIPTAGGPHADLAGHVANAIANSEDATCKFVTVVSPTADESELQDAQSRLEQTTAVIEEAAVETEVLENEDIAEGVLAESEQHDVTIVGATRESRLHQLVFGTLPETIGRRAHNITIMTRRQLGTKDRLVGRIRQRVSSN